ncbi:hypothetical protein Pcinc_013880 [Petrolisthes cinctipes]|uniref:Uncharacterized protein n=1 Tax=Petrolisthes cinctipes TaxID=88211 RepID=A0AAE1FXR7_PETCI|nr:hypothetical protein Pcinc_013880 [Petrolisthes cinctipes]
MRAAPTLLLLPFPTSSSPLSVLTLRAFSHSPPLTHTCPPSPTNPLLVSALPTSPTYAFPPYFPPTPANQPTLLSQCPRLVEWHDPLSPVPPSLSASQPAPATSMGIRGSLRE